MPVSSQGIALNVGVFALANEIRRSAGTFALNYQSGNGVNILNYEIAAGASFPYTPSFATSVLLINASDKILADIITTAVVVGTTTRPGGAYTQVVNGILIMDDSISSVVLRNPQITPVRISIIQG